MHLKLAVLSVIHAHFAALCAALRCAEKGDVDQFVMESKLLLLKGKEKGPGSESWSVLKGGIGEWQNKGEATIFPKTYLLSGLFGTSRKWDTGMRLRASGRPHTPIMIHRTENYTAED